MMLAAFKRFFSASEASVQGYLSLKELYRSILTALGSGTSIGIVILVLQNVLSNVSVVFPNPTVASLATVILTMVLDLLRRQSHGTVPTPPVSPAPATGTFPSA